MKELIVFDPNYEPLGILPSVISSTYVEKFQSLGTFSVQMSLTERVAELCKPENVILFDQDNGIAGVISSISESITEEEETLTVEGSLCAEYLYRRICWGQYSKSGTAQEIAVDLINTQVTNPVEETRKIADVVADSTPIPGLSQTSLQNTGGIVGEAIESICLSSDIGYKSKYLPIQKQIQIVFYRGTDRTISQKVVPPCIFATAFENLLTASYSTNRKEYKNLMLVAGSGEGKDRKTVTVGDTSVSGKLRRELFVDARDIQEVDETGAAIPEEKYNQMLTQRGEERKAETKISESFDCTINSLGNLQYGVDYFLGDTVTIEVAKLGLTLSAVVTEVEVSETVEGREIYCTFGYGAPTLSQKIKRLVR